ncbi:hypothetical protein P3X46_017577 [Hevea brasiliensis]|uniref:F-box domain-containing protein n=1 Tax=Hevea brasiliensis TaxID=3981 RepID=A0ABQ9LS78_HEVBR|nr:putative F-box protein At1g67623 [Hevea brasiliensis]KAJ9169374.1 hypothetical protein P3X46_017577 [Hevea brasiliensis]
MPPLSLKPAKTIAKCRRKNYAFKNVPKELLTEILARVGSSSLTDLVNAKVSCKEFLEAASEDYVFEHVKMDSIPLFPWRDEHYGLSSFLARCTESGNPEALFRQGMMDYFFNWQNDSGLKFLERAASKGHPAATYVYGIILVRSVGHELRNKGVKLLTDLKRSTSSLGITECRKKAYSILQPTWGRSYMIEIGPAESEVYWKKKKTCSDCKSKALRNPTQTINRWIPDTDFQDDPCSCDSCLWDLEAIKFCMMQRTGRYTLTES